MVYGLNQQFNNPVFKGNNGATQGNGAIKDVVPQNVAQKLPENVQDFSAQDAVKNNMSYQMLEGMGLTDPKVLAGTGGIWAVFITLRNILDKKFGGNWDDSLLGKISHVGDAISNKTNGLGKFVPKSIKNAASKSSGFVKNTAHTLTNKSAFLRALKETPLVLENRAARNQGSGIAGFVANDTKEFLGEYVKNNDGNLTKIFGSLKGVIQDPKEYAEFSKALADAGKNAAAQARESFVYNPQTTKGLGGFLKGKGKAVATEATEEVINAARKEYIKKAVVSTRNNMILQKLSGIFELPGENKKAMEGIIKSLAKNGSEQITVKSASHIPFLNLKVTTGEMANKLIATMKLGDRSKLSKTLTYLTGTTMEGLTSMFAGKKIGPLLAALFLASSAKKAVEAPKGKKLSTFMDEETTTAAMLATMPLQTRILQKIGGMLKYVGMGGGKGQVSQKEAVQAYRNKVKYINEVKDNISLGHYKALKKEAKQILNGKTHFWQKPFKFIGQVLGSGFEAETIKPFVHKGAGSSVMNFINKGLYTLKRGYNNTPGASGILRFMIVMFFISPFLQKPIRYVTNKIFGKPYDKEKEEAEKNKKLLEEKTLKAQELIKQHPEIIDNIKNYPELVQRVQQNPDSLVEILNDPQILAVLQNPAKQNSQNTQGAGNTNTTSQLLDKFIRTGSVAPNANQPQTQMQNMQPHSPYINPQVAYNNQMAPQYGPYQMQPNYSTPNQYVQYPYNTTQGYSQPASMQGPISQNTNAVPKAPAPNIKQNEPVIENSSKPIEEPEPQRSYIPSSKPGNFSKQQQADAINPGVSLMLDKADKAEANAMKYL